MSKKVGLKLNLPCWVVNWLQRKAWEKCCDDDQQLQLVKKMTTLTVGGAAKKKKNLYLWLAHQRQCELNSCPDYQDVMLWGRKILLLRFRQTRVVQKNPFHCHQSR